MWSQRAGDDLITEQRLRKPILKKRKKDTSLYGAHTQILLAGVPPPRRHIASQGTQLPSCSCFQGWFQGSPGVGFLQSRFRAWFPQIQRAQGKEAQTQGPVFSTGERTQKPNGLCVMEQRERALSCALENGALGVSPAGQATGWRPACPPQ